MDSSQLQSYIDKINEIKNAQNTTGSALFDSLQIEEYAVAIEGLEAKQAALLLSTQGLTNAQITETLIEKEGNSQKAYEAMLNAGLLKSKQSLINTELQNTIATKIGNEEDAKAIMTSMGLSVAIEGEEAQTVQLTAKKLQQAVASGLLTEVQAREIAMTTGVSLAQEGAIVSTTGLTNAMKALKLTLKSNPLLMIATAAPIAITGISKLVDKLITTKKELEEQRQKIRDLGEETKNAVNSINSDFESTKSTVDDVAQRYATLAQEVGNLGKASQNQGTLSNDEYSEFLDISNQLADLFPRLTYGYDDNGNAILDLSGDVDTITTSLYNLVDAEKAAASVEIQEKMGDIWGAYSQNVNDYSKEYNRLGAEKNGLSSFYTAMSKGDIDYLYNYYHDFEDLFLKAGIDESVFNQVSTWSDFSEAQQNAISDAYALIIKEYERDINDCANKINSENKDFSKYLITSLQGTNYYEELGEYKSIVNSLLTNYGYDTELNKLRGSDNWDKALEYIQDSIIKPFNNLLDEDKQVFQEYYNKLLSLDADAALADNIPKIEAYVTKLAELLHMDEKQLSISLGYDLESDKEDLETAKNRLGYNRNASGAYDAQRNAVINSVVSDLDDSQLQALLNADIPDDINTYTKEQLMNFIQGLSEIAEDNPVAISIASPLADIKNAFSGLDGIYDSIIKGEAVSADEISRLKDAFGDIDNGDAFKKFEEVMTAMPGDADAGIEALNDLATAYINNSDLMENLTEENAEYAKSELKKIGVANADAIVEQMLTNKYGVEAGVIRECVNANLSYNGAKLTAANTTDILANATVGEINQMIAEASAAGVSCSALASYAFQKIQAQRATITTDGDISNLLGLCEALNISTKLVRTYIDVKNRLAEAIQSNAPSSQITAMESQVNNLYNQIQAKINSGTKANTLIGGSYSGGSGGGGGSSASEAADKSKEYDWIQTGIQRCEEALSRLNKAEENTYTEWTKRNNALNGQISETSKEITYLQKAYESYMEKANSIGLSEEYRAKVQNGTIQIETITDENLQQQIDDYQKWYEEAVSVKDKIDDLNLSLSQLAEQKFDNIVSQFEEQENIFTSFNDRLEASINLAEAKGRLISKTYYETMRENENANNKLLVSQRDEMVRSLNEAVASGAIREYSEAWYDLQSQISDANKAVIESNTALQELDNSIRALDWEIFDLIQDKVTDIADEIEFVTSLLDDEILTDGYADRGLTDKGITQLGNYASRYNIYMAQAEQYAEKVRKLEQEIAKDPANQDLINRKQELIEKQQDLILSANAEKQAMLDLARDGYDAVLDTLQELIDKRKEALNSEKELYEYQKTIAEKTKNIASIRKQLSVIEQDNSEEAKKTIQQLKVELSEAEQDLKDTEYDKYISDQENMLDEFYQDYSDKIDEKFEQVDILFQELIGIVNDNADMIGDTIASAAKEAGYTLSSELADIWNGTGTVISDFNGQFISYATTIQTALNGIRLTIEQMLKIAQSEADRKIEEINKGNVSSEGAGSAGGNPQPIQASQSNTPPNTANTASTNAENTSDTQMSASVGTQIPNASGNWYYDSNGTAPTGDVNRWKPDYFIIDKIVEGRAYPYHIQAYINGRAAGGNGWVKGNQIGYRTGLKEAMYDHLAWTQEGGGEIIRTSDGALLTPVPRGTTVFTRSMTDNLWNFADNPKAFIGDMIRPLQTNLTGKSDSGNIELNIENITLPNVTKPEEFCDGLIHAMQSDSRVIRAMRAVNVDALIGKNSKRVNRF